MIMDLSQNSIISIEISNEFMSENTNDSISIDFIDNSNNVVLIDARNDENAFEGIFVGDQVLTSKFHLNFDSIIKRII